MRWLINDGLAVALYAKRNRAAAKRRAFLRLKGGIKLRGARFLSKKIPLQHNATAFAAFMLLAVVLC